MAHLLTLNQHRRTHSSASSHSGAPSSAVSSSPSILERPINRTRQSEVSLSALAYLFSESIQYMQKRAAGIPDLEHKLGQVGYRVGIRMTELIHWREKHMKRELKFLQFLMFIHTNVWKALFGKQADALERSTDNEDEYMISDNDPVMSRFISVPKEMSQLNVNAFTAGIIEAMLEGYQFNARVTAHSVPVDGFPSRTTFLIKFEPHILDREKTTK